MWGFFWRLETYWVILSLTSSSAPQFVSFVRLTPFELWVKAITHTLWVEAIPSASRCVLIPVYPQCPAAFDQSNRNGWHSYSAQIRLCDEVRRGVQEKMMSALACASTCLGGIRLIPDTQPVVIVVSKPQTRFLMRCLKLSGSIVDSLILSPFTNWLSVWWFINYRAHMKNANAVREMNPTVHFSELNEKDWPLASKMPYWASKFSNLLAWLGKW